jgi:hypothetical protein
VIFAYQSLRNAETEDNVKITTHYDDMLLIAILIPMRAADDAGKEKSAILSGKLTVNWQTGQYLILGRRQPRRSFWADR